MTCLGRLLTLLTVAGLLWFAMVTAAGAVVNRDLVLALFTALFVLAALLILAFAAREGART